MFFFRVQSSYRDIRCMCAAERFYGVVVDERMSTYRILSGKRPKADCFASFDGNLHRLKLCARCFLIFPRSVGESCAIKDLAVAIFPRRPCAVNYLAKQQGGDRAGIKDKVEDIVLTYDICSGQSS